MTSFPIEKDIMEKRLIKKEALAGIVGELAGRMRVYAPMQEEEQVLFRLLSKDEKPLLDYANTKNAPKNFLFPRTETLLKFTRTGKGMIHQGETKAAEETVLFVSAPVTREALPSSTCFLTRKNMEILTTSKRGPRRPSWPWVVSIPPIRPASAPPSMGRLYPPMGRTFC